jgi:hypothetical protein
VVGGIEVPLGAINFLVDFRFDSRKQADPETGTVGGVANQITTVAQTTTGYFRVGPLFRYTAGALVAHARADIWLPNDDQYMETSTGKWGLPYPRTEELGKTAVAFRIGADYALNSTTGLYGQLGSDNALYLAGTEKGYYEGNGLYINLGAKFSFGSSSIEIFNKINKIGAKKAPDIAAGSPGGPSKGTNPLTNQFQIDFNLSF